MEGGLQLLDKGALAGVGEEERAVLVYTWLQGLNTTLPTASRQDVKQCQAKLVTQLMEQVVSGCPGPPARQLLASCIATLFSVGEVFALNDTINKCNDLLRTRDDSPSFLPCRLAALVVVGGMYSKLGRMMGRSYEETVGILTKGLKNAESQTRAETMVTLGKVCLGLGAAAASVHKEIYKACRTCLTDRAVGVRVGAAECLTEMLPYAAWLHTTELDSLAQLCFRGLEGAGQQGGPAIACLLGSLLAATQEGVGTGGGAGRARTTTPPRPLEDVLAILGQGFLRGGSSSLMKSGGVAGPELRAGLARAYTALFTKLGPTNLERSLPTVLTSVLELAASPRAGQSHTEAVQTRACVGFILSWVLARLLGEKAQLAACKELAAILGRSLGPADQEGEAAGQAQLQVCALLQLGSLAAGLGTATASLLTEPGLKLLDCVIAGLLSPAAAVRLASAQCLRQVAGAVPSVLTPLLDKCLEALDSYKSSEAAVSGYSAGLAALLGAVRASPNGIPHTRGKIIFNCGEELLRSAAQSSRLSEARTRAGWLLIGAIMSLGVGVVRGLLPRCMLLWRNAFPRSTRELDGEKARGDAFTWQVSLEARAGALATIHSFVTACPDLVTEDILRRLAVPLEAALKLLEFLGSPGSPTKSYSGQLKAPTTLVRLRLLEVAAALPVTTLENSYTILLKLLVTEFCLADPTTAPTATSLLAGLVTHKQDCAAILPELPADGLERQLVEQVGGGAGLALEHDPCWLYRCQPATPTTAAPGSLPLGVAVIDQSITVFGRVFPRAAPKHRLQLLQHFHDCLKTGKAARVEALQTNIYSALLAGLRGLVEAGPGGLDRAGAGPGRDLAAAAVGLARPGLTAAGTLQRAAAAEILGRAAQAVRDSKLMAELAQHSFDCLKSARDVASRTGHSLALGCLHRYVGGLGSSQHLKTSVSILMALAQDAASPLVQAWALHSLALIADSGGPLFRDFTEPAIGLVVRQVLASGAGAGAVQLQAGLARLLAAILTTLGPELGEGGGAGRAGILLAISVLRAGSATAQAAGLACLQQLHMFAPRLQVEPELVHVLASLLGLTPHPHLPLRRAALACLRQLAQREAGVVYDHGEQVTSGYSEPGLPGLLFSLLDREDDPILVQHAQQTLNSLLTATAAANLTVWLSLSREVLTVQTDAVQDSADTEKFDDGDDVEFTVTAEESGGRERGLQPRWTTRVFAAQCLRRIILDCCDGDRAHFDLGLAREVGGSRDFLVLHLSELVRMAFMAATSDSDPLRLEGLLAMQAVIERFAGTADELVGHGILEQHQAQVGAALRPAFSPDTASHVTATACAVCSSWISSGVARDLADLRRVYQLLVTSLAKLKRGAGSSCYNESASTLEKLSILKAWAEVYIVSMAQEKEDEKEIDEDFGDFSGDGEDEAEGLSSLVAAELPSLSKHWLAALKDHALLSLGPEFKSQLPYEGGAFYTQDTIELARPHYRQAWPPILHAASVWLARGGGFDNVSNEKTELDVTGSANIGLGPANATSSGDPEEINRSRLHLLLGAGLEALCGPRELDTAQLDHCLAALAAMLSSEWARGQLGATPPLLVELCNVLHRQLLTREAVTTQARVLAVVSLASKAAVQGLAASRRAKLKQLFPANQEPEEGREPAAIADLGEGGEEGLIKPGQAVSFAVLEVCVAVLVRYLPAVSPRAAQSSSVIAMQARGRTRYSACLTPDQAGLVGAAVGVVAGLPTLLSPAGCATLLPTLLYLVTGVLRETAVAGRVAGLTDRDPVSACLAALQSLASVRQPAHPAAERACRDIVQAALARVLDLAKTAAPAGDTEHKQLDEVTLLLAVKAFLVAGSPDLLASPATMYPAVNAFSCSLQSRDTAVQTRCLQILTQLVREAELAVAVPYIQATVPTVVDWGLGGKLIPSNPGELSRAVEGLALLEVVLAAAAPARRPDLLQLHIPVLVACMAAAPGAGVDQHHRQLHDTALARLTDIGTQYRQTFTEVLNSHPAMRQRLEAAVIQKNTEKQVRLKAEAVAASVATKQAQPTIKLNMDNKTVKLDFSKFQQSQ